MNNKSEPKARNSHGSLKRIEISLVFILGFSLAVVSTFGSEIVGISDVEKVIFSSNQGKPNENQQLGGEKMPQIYNLIVIPKNYKKTICGLDLTINSETDDPAQDSVELEITAGKVIFNRCFSEGGQPLCYLFNGVIDGLQKEGILKLVSVDREDIRFGSGILVFRILEHKKSDRNFFGLEARGFTKDFERREFDFNSKRYGPWKKRMDSGPNSALEMIDVACKR